MRGLNSETILICGGNLGGFLRISPTVVSPKSTSIDKYGMGVNAEVDNQRNCLVMCLDQMAGFAITSVVRSRCRRRSISLAYFLKTEHS